MIDYKVFLFELDDVLYPRKEYVLQVYYLFSNFIEYTEGKPIAKEILHDMKLHYETYGEMNVLNHIIEKYKLPQDIKENFGRLMANAQLPLKLELYTSAILYVGDLISRGKNVAILTKGNPVEQLNKVRQINWRGLDRYFKVYFWDELIFREIKPYIYAADEFGVKLSEVYHVIRKP